MGTSAARAFCAAASAEPDGRIGLSRFSDDVWDLRPYVGPEQSAKMRRLDFTCFADGPTKDLFKRWCRWRLGKVKAVTVATDMSALKRIYRFMQDAGIASVSELTRSDVLAFAGWLRDSGTADTYNCKATRTLEHLVSVGRQMGWDVPDRLSFAGLGPTELWGTPRGKRTEPIPDHVMERILRCALEAEDDVVDSALVVLLSQTGLRASEVLSIRPGCAVREPDGSLFLEAVVSKTLKGEPHLHRILVNELVAEAVGAMESACREVARAGGDRLFFVMADGVPRDMTTSDVRNRLTRFCKRHGIDGADGRPFPLHPHMFRATYVRDLVRKGVPLAFVMERFGHVSIEMTAHYLQLERDEIRDIWAKAVIGPNARIAGKRARAISGAMAERFKGKTAEEVDAIVSELSESMTFNPLPTGVCLYDVRRGPCPDGESCIFYDCPNFVTDERFLPVLRRELDLLGMEMARLKSAGMEREWQRQYARARHLRPLVEQLEESEAEDER